jgi:ABC-2 type transport system permease protein
VFPLTGSLVAVRGALLEGETPGALGPALGRLTLLSALLLAAVALILRVGEAHAQRTGKLRLA